MLHIFYATVVLVMDICVNKDGNDRERLEEVREALNIIEQTKDASEMGAQFSDSLLAVLRKHHVKLPNANGPRATDVGRTVVATQHGFFAHSLVGQEQQSNRNPGHFDAPSVTDAVLTTGGLEFDGGMWQDFIDQGQMLDTQDWEALLQDLDMHIL